MKKKNKFLSFLLAGVMSLMTVQATFASAAESYTAYQKPYVLDGGWVMAVRNFVQGDSAGIYMNDAHEGDNSYCVTISQKVSGKKIEMRADVSKGVTGAGTYRLGFWYKGAGNPPMTANMDWATNTVQSWVQTAGEDGWRYAYGDITTSKAMKTLYIILEQQCSLLIDDVSLKKIDANGNAISEEIIQNGGFEACAYKEDYEANGWSTTYRQTANYPWVYDKEVDFPSITSGIKRNGEHALLLSYGATTGSERYFRFINSKMKLPAGNYVIEYWGKGSYADNYTIRAGLFWNDSRIIDIGVHKTSTVDNDGWTRFGREFSVAANDTSEYSLEFLVQKSCTMVIDDFKLYEKSNPDVNLIPNGDFEDCKWVDKKSLVNPIAYPIAAGSGATVSWKNPDNASISDIKIYVDDVEQTDFVADNNALAYNQYVITGLENGKEYTIKLVHTVGGDEYTKELAVVPEEGREKNFAGNQPLKDWNIWHQDRETDGIVYYANMSADIDSQEKYSGNSSFKLSANMNTIPGNVYAYISQNLKLNRNAMYRIKFKYKTDNVGRFNLIQTATVYEDKDDPTTVHNYFTQTSIINNDGTTSGWKEFSAILNLTTDDAGNNYQVYDVNKDEEYNTSIRFLVEKAVGSLWIDDVEIYEVDPWDDATAIGENLIKNPGFEFLPYTIFDPEYSIVLDDNMELPTDYLESGMVKVTAKIKNVNAGDDLETSVIMALYNGEKLEQLSITEKAIDEQAFYIPADEYSTIFNVPELTGGNYKIKVMYWNGLDTMQPIGEIDELLPAPEEV